MESSEPPPWHIYLVIIVILLLFSMFFSAAETAVLSSSRLRIRYLKEKGSKAAARVDRLLDRKDFFLNLILIGNNVVNIATSSLITSLSMKIFGDAGVGIATACATIIILIFGEILPKTVALQRSESIALSFSLPLAILALIMAPVVFVFSAITKFLSFIIDPSSRREKSAEKQTVTEEDIRTLIEVGEEDGVIESHERTLMNNILSYTDLTVRDVMTPRKNVAAVNVNASRNEIIELSRQSCFSRFPVYGEDIDDILGTLYVKDFIFSRSRGDEPFSVQQYMRPALFMLENRRITELQATLRQEKQGIAIILDEYGGTAGIVTASDLAAELFGPVMDEYDDQTAKTESPKNGAEERIMLIDGTERLSAINDRFGLQLSSDFYETIGGYILEKSGEVPPVGFSVQEADVVFTVQALDGNRVAMIQTERLGALK